MEDKTVCAYCGRKFANVKARASHQNNCPEYKKVREAQELEWEKTKHYCSICGKEITKFKRYGNALETCDNKDCIKQALSRQRSEKAKKEWQSPEYRDKIKATSQEKYGTDSPLQAESVKDKIKSTNFERYGVESLLSSKEFHENAKQVMLDRYGVDNPMKAEEFQDKAKQTNLEKYGVEYTFQSEEVKEKIKQTSLERYGVEHPSESEKIKEKIRNTNISKYGVVSPLQSEEVWNTYRENYFKKHGVYHPLQNETVREKFWSTKRRNIFEHSKLILSRKHIVPLFDINYFSTYPKEKDYFYHCEKCGQDFISQKSSAIRVFCPNCIGKLSSNIEFEIKQFIETLGITNIQQNQRFLHFGDSTHPKEVDIYLPDYKFAIEIDGLYWHSDKSDDFHYNKTRICQELGINLIHITDSEWANKQEICKSIIRNYLGKSENNYYARNCEVRKISNEEYQEFCEENHIQGFTPAKVKLGLFYKEELIQIASFGKSRFKSNETELIRSCTKLNTNIVGGLSKLIKYYVKEYNPENLVTYCDRRWFNGNGYKNSGWEVIEITQPNYWYFSLEEYYLHSRIKFQKHKLDKLLLEFYPDLTEKENMELNGWMRYYDCGSLKFRYKPELLLKRN